MSKKARIIMYSILVAFIALAVYAKIYSNNKEAERAEQLQNQTQQVQTQTQTQADDTKLEVIN